MSLLDIERIEGVPTARVHEDVDAANVAIAHQRLADALDPDASCLIVDLSQARYFDSAGIDMLLRLGDRLDHRRARLLLVIPDGSRLERLATIVGLSDAIAIHSTLELALRGARAMGTHPRASQAEGRPVPDVAQAQQPAPDAAQAQQPAPDATHGHAPRGHSES